jgi:hypothetical protein
MPWRDLMEHAQPPMPDDVRERYVCEFDPLTAPVRVSATTDCGRRAGLCCRRGVPLREAEPQLDQRVVEARVDVAAAGDHRELVVAVRAAGVVAER